MSQTPKEVQARMISLRHELRSLRHYLEMNQAILDDPKGDLTVIDLALQILERETHRMGLVAEGKTLDQIVVESLRRAGIEPGEPKK